MAKKYTDIGRPIPEGQMPLIDIEGTTEDAGRMLGAVWAEVLRHEADHCPAGRDAWWRDRRLSKAVDRYAAHLPTLYRAMAKSAGVDVGRIGPRGPVELPDRAGGCTSFALAPDATLDRQPISGQTKDVSANRAMQMRVLRLALTDAPPMLTLTYQGWLFGHGFVKGGCTIFRNSLFAREGDGKGLPYNVWGLLALHCPTVDHVEELTRRYGCAENAHCTIADEKGGVMGIELVAGRMATLKARRGVYAHANAVITPRLRRFEHENAQFSRTNSYFRGQRLHELLDAARGRLTPQLAYCAMCDQQNHPLSICRAESLAACSAASIVAEPTLNRIHVTRGLPSQNWPITYRL